MIVDAHVHIWPRWPYEPRVPDDTTRGSHENLVFEMQRAGVDLAIAVNARIARSADNNDYGMNAAAAHPGRVLNVVDFDSRWSGTYHAPGAAERLRLLIDRFRPAGVSHYLNYENDGWLASAEADAVFRHVAESGLFISLAAPPIWFPDLSSLAARHPSVPVLVNHLAVLALHPGGVHEALELVDDATACPNLLVKVSGFYYGSDRPWDYPYADRMWLAKWFCDRWGARRMVWASDWPSVLVHMSYRQSLEVLREHSGFLGSAELTDVLGDNMMRVLKGKQENGRLP